MSRCKAHRDDRSARVRAVRASSSFRVAVADSISRILYSTCLSGAPPLGNAFKWGGSARGPAGFEAVFEGKKEIESVLRREREKWAER